MNSRAQHFSVTDSDVVKDLLLPRPEEGHKGTFGHALLVAGSRGMAGAAVLAARSALRSGLGKLSVLTHLCNTEILQVAVPEAILLQGNSATTSFSSCPSLSSFKAVAVGPAMGCNADSLSLLKSLMQSCNVPLVLDADALTLLSQNPTLWDCLPSHSILTPHLGELSRLVGHDVEKSERVNEAWKLAANHKCYIIMKGHPTVVCTPQAEVFVNTTGTHAIATAGSGDVLTGMLLGLLAQGYSPLSACRLGVYLHGLSGEIAAKELGPRSVIASDIIANIGKAFLTIET